MDCCDPDDDVVCPAGPLRVYIAARYSRKAEVRELARLIEQCGAKVCTEWFNGPECDDAKKLGDLYCENAASTDVNSVSTSNLFVVLSGSGRHGGMHFETGLAFAQGIPIWLVGEPENIFQCLPWIERFANCEEMLSALRREVETWQSR